MVAEELVEFLKPLKDVEVKRLPSTVSFDCEVSAANIRVQWLKDDVPITTKKSTKYEAISEGRHHKLIIKDVDGKDEGQYIILAKNNKSKATLSVAAPPVFTIDDRYKDTLVLKEGDSTAIEIPFSANPQPRVTWQFNKERIPFERRFTTDVIWNMTSLCIGRAQVNDSGNYDVTLENPHGKVTMTIKVIVKGKCRLLISLVLIVYGCAVLNGVGVHSNGIGNKSAVVFSSRSSQSSRRAQGCKGC